MENNMENGKSNSLRDSAMMAGHSILATMARPTWGRNIVTYLKMLQNIKKIEN